MTEKKTIVASFKIDPLHRHLPKSKQCGAKERQDNPWPDQDSNPVPRDY
jgi:hypothetical protein